MKRFLLPVLLLQLLAAAGFAQSNPHRCGTMPNLARHIQAHPELADRMAQTELQTQAWIANHPRVQGGAVTIPVVVHVIYNNSTENISTAQVQSQIDVLNADFGLRNADSLPSSHPFWGSTANTQIQFCLATRDPNGNPTTGITRTSTSVTAFNGNGDEKFTASGGKDNWDPTRYLNLWVCDLGASGGTLGYAAFPDELAVTPAEDGVVIHYEAFGTLGTAGQGGFDVNDLGRTGTHEVGHWLNLFHIWGDNQPNCGDDLVSDTEPDDNENYGCPAFPEDPNNACGSGNNGVMFMNYMDYVDDACMMMFTFGQSQRMNAVFSGDRSGLLASQGCAQSAGIGPESVFANLRLAPNPSTGMFELEGLLPSAGKCKVLVTNSQGTVVHETMLLAADSKRMDLSLLPAGIYNVHLSTQRDAATFKAAIFH